MSKRKFSPTQGLWKIDKTDGAISSILPKGAVTPSLPDNETVNIAIMLNSNNDDESLMVNAKRMYYLLDRILKGLQWCQCESCIDCALEHEIKKLLNEIEKNK